MFKAETTAALLDHQPERTDYPGILYPTEAEAEQQYRQRVHCNARRDAQRVLRGRESGFLNRRAWSAMRSGRLACAVWHTERHAERYAEAVIADRVDPFAWTV